MCILPLTRAAALDRVHCGQTVYGLVRHQQTQSDFYYTVRVITSFSEFIKFCNQPDTGTGPCPWHGFTTDPAMANTVARQRESLPDDLYYG